MASKIDETVSVDRESFGKVLLEDEAYTVLSLCDHLSLAENDDAYVAECCAPCPSYTTVPCSC